MKIELKLQSLLHQFNLFKYGIEKDIAEYCNVHRHTIGKIFRNEARNPSLIVLGKICGYLIEKGVPADLLPGALFDFKPAEVWKAIGRSTKVTICLGMYKHINQNKKPGPALTTVARHDATAESKISHLLTTEAEMGGSRPAVNTRYIPFHFSQRPEDVEGDWFEEDKRHASRTIFEEIMSPQRSESVILIGSQRANYLVEYFVADLFGCKPFKSIKKNPAVPIYFRYRPYDRRVPSCFGGRGNPFGNARSNKCGILFPDEKNEWQLYDWEKDKRGSAAVITLRSADSMKLALFGFSGRSTNAICNELINRPENFWPANKRDFNPDGDATDNDEKKSQSSKKKTAPGTTVIRNSCEIGVYICRVTYSEADGEMKPWAEIDYDNDEVEVTPLSRSVLEKYLPKKRRPQNDG